MENQQHKKTIISVREVYKSFQTSDRHTTVLRNVSLDINQGEFLVIFGPSGCGKSTLLHVIMGLEMPDAGVVKLGGINIWDLDSEDRAIIRKKSVGIIYQQQNWIKSLSVAENIALNAQLIGIEKKEALDRAKEMLDLVGMDYRKKYVPNELSAGEQQKIGLARALMTKPQILIADEPTGNLDVKSGEIVIKLLKKLSDEGTTVIMVTHNPDYLRHATRVIFMLDGQVRRELEVSKEDSNAIQRKIAEDMIGFISEGSELIVEDESKIPLPKTNVFESNRKVKFLNSLVEPLLFNIRFLLQSLMFLFYGIFSLFNKVLPKSQSFADSFRRFFTHIFNKLGHENVSSISPSISSVELTEISYRNLWVKRNRTVITIVGMAIGIGFIVFLLSLGYGLERLIIAEITKIEDMRQVDISKSVGSNIKLDSESLKNIEKIDGVEEIMPIYNLAARVGYKGANTDVVVNGVQSKYLYNSPISFTSGKHFDDNTNQVVINNNLLTAIGQTPEDVIGQQISVNLVTPKISIETASDTDLETDELGDEAANNEIEMTENLFTITGVLEDKNSPSIFIPSRILDEFKIAEYSQIRIIIDSDEKLIPVRKQIESMGLLTSSIMDTVSEVELFFVYAKLFLSIVGAIALIIAVLGMINTLTVSLLERTREVGLLKTLGMNSNEIRTLFISESMLMGISGGIIGVLLGLSLGLISSGILSIFSISRGGEVIVVSFLPISLVIGIVIASTFVGYLTGLYPSQRAVKMPPLDALRYE